VLQLVARQKHVYVRAHQYSSPAVWYDWTDSKTKAAMDWVFLHLSAVVE